MISIINYISLNAYIYFFNICFYIFITKLFYYMNMYFSLPIITENSKMSFLLMHLHHYKLILNGGWVTLYHITLF